MGCKVSKLDDLPLVVICKKRKELIRAAAYHRYALAVAHLSYFSSLRDVGDALHRFVDEDLLLSSASSSPSSLSSPVLTLPSDDAHHKHRRRNQKQKQHKDFCSPTPSISHSADEESEMCFSSEHQSKASSSSSGRVRDKKRRNSPRPGMSYSPTTPMMNNYTNYYNPDYLNGNQYGGYGYDPSSGFYPNYGVHYMKKDSGRVPSVIYEEPKTNTIYSYSDYGNVGGDLGFGLGGGSGKGKKKERSPVALTPPSPKVSGWEYFNPFEGFEDVGYSGYFVNGADGYDSDKGSLDSWEVREREGIPGLEEETDSEVFKDERKKRKDRKKKNKDLDDGFSELLSKNKDRNVQFDVRRGYDFAEGNYNGVPMQEPRKAREVEDEDEKESSPLVAKEAMGSSLSSEISNQVSLEEVWLRGGGGSFEMDEPLQRDVQSSKLSSSLTALSVHGTRDLGEVVGEIQVEFEAATDYGDEVCQLLEAGKLPYQAKSTFLNVMLSRMPCPVEESVSAIQPQPRTSVSADPNVSGIRKACVGDLGSDMDSQGPSLVSTLDKLYVWEKKLYGEVKYEEKLRVMYEKKCKKLKHLNYQGVDASKLEATEESIKMLSTRINMSIKTVNVIAGKIHQLRDGELLPQLKKLIIGMQNMWGLMLNCHKKQLKAIFQSKITKLRGNTDSYRDSAVRATTELEMEIRKWCNRFNSWVELQKSYVKSLNAWLLTYITNEQEETPDGPAPYSPGQLGAPPIFIICNDWMQAMERISQSGVSETVQTAMNAFASILHELRATQDEEQCLRAKAEHTLKDFERQIYTHQGNDVSSEKGSNLSVVLSDLESAKHRVKTERAEHKEAIKQVHAAVARSIKAGFIPIFEALDTFTAEAVKAYDNVRLNGLNE